MMIFSAFVNLVRQMRAEQKAFFEGERNPEHIRLCKKLEREVDKAIKDQQDTEPRLFSGDDL